MLLGYLGIGCLPVRNYSMIDLVANSLNSWIFVWCSKLYYGWYFVYLSLILSILVWKKNLGVVLGGEYILRIFFGRFFYGLIS